MPEAEGLSAAPGNDAVTASRRSRSAARGRNWEVLFWHASSVLTFVESVGLARAIDAKSPRAWTEGHESIEELMPIKVLE